MKICLKQKLKNLKSYTSLVFNTFSFEPRKIKIILVYKMVPKIHRNHKLVPTSISLCLAAARSYAAGGPRPRRVRGQLDPGGPAEDTWMAPWSLLAPTRVPGHLGVCHAAHHAPRRLLRPPPRHRARPGSVQPSPDLTCFASKPSSL